jgi:hypothetical protein
MIHAIPQANHIQRRLRRHGVACDVRDERHVFTRGEAGDEVVELEDETHAVAAELRQDTLICIRDLPAFVADAAFRRDVQPAEDVQQRALARAGRTEQHDEFTCGELHVHMAQRHHVHLAGVIDFPQTVRLEDGRLARTDWRRHCG